MNYKFFILWFEDNPTWFRRARSQADILISNHCMECVIERRRNSELNIDDIKANNYDLILMDFDLQSTENGDQLIKKIRDNQIYTDILFYSSQYNAMLSAIVNLTPPIDGIYYANRKNEEFGEKLERVVNKIVCRSEDLINLRGFVLDNSSDFEIRIKEILNICYQKFSPQEKESLRCALDNVFENKLRHINSNVSDAKASDDMFSYANNENRLLSVSDRLDILNVALYALSNHYGFAPNIKKNDFKQYYINTIGKYRNRLGHAKTGDNYIKLDGKNIPIDQNLHRLLRNNIAECEKQLSAMESFISENI